MNYFKNIFAGFLLVFCFAGYSKAGTITLPDTTLFTSTGTDESEDYISHGWGAVDWISGTGDYVEWAHNFTFDPAAASITNAKLLITFYDDETDKKKLLSREWAFGVSQSGQWDLGEVNAATYSYNVDVRYLADGKFRVLVGSLLGDFGITKSDLSITYESVIEDTPQLITHPVPEPSFLILLGLGIGAVSFLTRK